GCQIENIIIFKDFITSFRSLQDSDIRERRNLCIYKAELVPDIADVGVLGLPI
nr:hypothetical protein [Chloroflexota bacterium]